MLPAVFKATKNTYIASSTATTQRFKLVTFFLFWWHIWLFFSNIHPRHNFSQNTFCHQYPTVVTKIIVFIWKCYLPETQYWVLPISHISILRHFSLFFLFYHFVPLVSLLLFFLKLTKSRIFVPRKTNVEFDKFFAVPNRRQWWSDLSSVKSRKRRLLYRIYNSFNPECSRLTSKG